MAANCSRKRDHGSHILSSTNGGVDLSNRSVLFSPQKFNGILGIIPPTVKINFSIISSTTTAHCSVNTGRTVVVAAESFSRDYRLPFAPGKSSTPYFGEARPLTFNLPLTKSLLRSAKKICDSHDWLRVRILACCDSVPSSISLMRDACEFQLKVSRVLHATSRLFYRLERSSGTKMLLHRSRFPQIAP